jgi:anti-sigma factor RsiW
MECDRARRLLSGLLDQALGPLTRLRVGRHVGRCDDCGGRLEELRAMQAMIRTKLPYHRAPPGLAARIGAVLPREAPMPLSRPWFRWPAVALSGSGFAGALAGVALTVLVLHGQDDPASAVVGSHIRSLQAAHLTDVPSSDQHTVKPWLSARLDLSPPVRELKDAGFPLVGGRLDYVDGHPTAVVVYRHAQHVINLFAWVAGGHRDAPLRTAEQQGFNIVTWQRGGIVFYAVSDVSADQLAEFARLVSAPGG